MIPINKGKYTARMAQGASDMARVLDARARCFGAAGGAADNFDATATHIVVEDAQTGAVMASFRMQRHMPAQINESYAAQFYDLDALRHFDGPMLELGRFCIPPAHSDPDILRIAWAALTAYVDADGIRLLFGCASFAGTDPEIYRDGFALLKARHLAPAPWQPKPRAPQTFDYGKQIQHKPDLRKASAALPPLLRTYLLMGGWVSDHAVIDRQLGTLHVFTALETGAIPPARKKLLRALV